MKIFSFNENRSVDRICPGFAPDPTRGAHDAHPDLLVGWGGHPSQTPPHSVPWLIGSVPVDIISGYASDIFCPVDIDKMFRNQSSTVENDILPVFKQHRWSWIVFKMYGTIFTACWWSVHEVQYGLIDFWGSLSETDGLTSFSSSKLLV